MKEITEQFKSWDDVPVGTPFKAILFKASASGKIQKQDGLIYYCQNKESGIDCNDKLGYKYSYETGMSLQDSISERKLKLYKIEKPMAKKTTTRQTVVRKFKTSNRSKWEIVKAVTGDKTEYFCRLTSRNGNILSTGRGMNNVQNAIKNIKAVMNSCKVVEPTVGKIKK